MKYILLKLKVRDGEREHLHKVLIETKCNNINFAVSWYAAHFYNDYYYAERPYKWNGNLCDIEWYQLNGEVCTSVYSYTELTKRHYNLMKKYLN